MGVLRTAEGLLLKLKTIILIIVIPDIVNRESIFGFLSDGSPPTTCGDDRSEWLCPTLLIGNPSSVSFQMDPRRLPAGMTAVSRPSRLRLAGIQAAFSFGWIPADYLRG